MSAMKQQPMTAHERHTRLAIGFGALFAFIVGLNLFGGFLPVGIQCALRIAICDRAPEKSYVVQMKSDLRNLITAQEAYFSDHESVYASELEAMGTNFRASSGVTVKIISVTSTGWSATATNESSPVTCRIELGGTATTQGEPVCK